MVKQDIRRQLSVALESVSGQKARLVVDPATVVEVYPAPFLHRYQIYSVKRLDYPLLIYIGFAPQQPVYILPGQPQSYTALAVADGVHIATSQQAIDYILVYLEVTRSMSQVFYLLSSAHDVRFTPEKMLKDAERERKALFEQTYTSIIVPPNVVSLRENYLVTLYMARNRTVERHTLTLQPDGAIDTVITPLEQNLPLLYAY